MMKKKRAVLFLLLGAAAMAVTGCSTGQISNEYVKISKYKGIEVPEVAGIPEITDDSVDNNIQKVREGFSKTKEVTDRAAKEGDVVILDYTASADGQAIEGGSVSDYQLELGSNTFFAEFENAVAGHSKGDSFEFEHKFQADYTNQAFAGKDVTFNITVKAVNEKVLPDLTDDFVQTISQKSDTVEEYKKEIKELLEEKNEDYIMTELEESAWKVILENTEVEKYPEKRLKEEQQTFYDHYKKGAETYDMEFTDFLAQMDLTEEDFEKQVTKASKSNLKENLAAELIADKENIKLTDKEYKKAKKSLAEEMSYDSVKDMEKEVPEDYIKSYITRDKVKEWVANNCVQVKGE